MWHTLCSHVGEVRFDDDIAGELTHVDVMPAGPLAGAPDGCKTCALEASRMQDVEAIFQAFVANANAMAREPRTARTPMQASDGARGKRAEASRSRPDAGEPVRGEDLLAPPSTPVQGGAGEVARSPVAEAWGVGGAARALRTEVDEPEVDEAMPTLPEDDPPTLPEEVTERSRRDITSGDVVLLTRRKQPTDLGDSPDDALASDTGIGKLIRMPGTHAPADGDDVDEVDEDEVLDADAEADDVVPDVARVTRIPPPLRERSADGQAPAGELDRAIADMAVLLRYGHMGEVAQRLAELQQRYPDDLLLLRRLTEFHLEHGLEAEAMECLFTLASRLFERHNFQGMREALEQVLVLDPDNRRAYKLLGLLDARPVTGSGR